MGDIVLGECTNYVGMSCMIYYGENLVAAAAGHGACIYCTQGCMYCASVRVAAAADCGGYIWVYGKDLCRQGHQRCWP